MFTINGIHYINGVPVHESVFGDDPFEPVTESYIPALLEKQMNEPVEVITRRDSSRAGELGQKDRGARLRDAIRHGEADPDAVRVRSASRRGRVQRAGGSTGRGSLRQCRRDRSGAGDRAAHRCMREHEPDLARTGGLRGKDGLCCRQRAVERLLETGLESAEGKAFLDALWAEYSKNEHLLIDTGAASAARGELPEEIGKSVASLLGAILKDLLDRGAVSRLMIIGGDTLLGFMDAIGCRELSPQREILQGVVESEYIYRGVRHSVLSKSGGFGQTNLLLRLESEAPVHA